MATTLELRYDPSSKYTSSNNITQATAGQVSMMIENENCYTAWLEVHPDPANVAEKFVATLLPFDSPNAYAPYLEAGGYYVIHASIQPTGFLRIKILN